MAINDPHHNQPTQIIPPAASPLEAEERISLFWTIFLLDRFASLSGDTNPSIPDNEIWTNWPRDPSEWESVRVLPYSINSLIRVSHFTRFLSLALLRLSI
ncbi:hypothetical protein DL93DRAFT_2081224 [Clavulina sp. PMI_390]|nr:hypothetical protein DL93DRAFT_2081224 [Clavulina sp. PMI_390]